MVRRDEREATIQSGLRFLLEWLEERRREYKNNMRKTWYYMHRRMSMAGWGPEESTYMDPLLPGWGQGRLNLRLQRQEELYRDQLDYSSSYYYLPGM